MIATTRKTAPSFAEFVALVSMLMSLTALSIDAMLPALAQIGDDLAVQSANNRQLIITMIFLGLALGQLFFGPWSDKTGRKPAIYVGLICYIAGAVLSAFSWSFSVLLIGRFLQGIGVSAPRAVTLALVRDQYEGRAMAQVMSFVMTVFILVPMIAPIMGQGILLIADWRAIFGAFIGLAIIVLIWFAIRQPETLTLDKRIPFSLRRIFNTTITILKIRPALGFTITAGLVSGAFLGYLNSAQQIFQEQYELGEMFSLYFSMIAFSIGLASFLNSRLVMHFGMRFLVHWSLRIITGLAIFLFGLTLLLENQPPLWLLTIYLMLTFFCVGILFGNMNALAMEPLGDMAGIGAAIVGSLSTLLSTLLGLVIGQAYNGTVQPLIIGLAVLAGISIFVVRWADG